MVELFNIGFLEIRFLDIIDILLVGLLLFQLYRLVKGSLAFNILIGLLLVYLASLVVSSFDMQLLSGILGGFVGVGLIAVLIVFQPEIRRFLLYLGRGSRFGSDSFWKRLSVRKWKISAYQELQIKEVSKALEHLSKTKTGAIIVYAVTSKLQYFANTGTILNAKISSNLVESIFFKNNPLHDGAVIISDNQILAAGCVLPLTENPDIPSKLGLRHRAAVGITEHSDALVLVVSEETGLLSYAREGHLYENQSIEDIQGVIHDVVREIYTPKMEGEEALESSNVFDG